MDEATAALLFVLSIGMFILLPFGFLAYRNWIVYEYRVQFLDEYYGRVNKCSRDERMRRYYSLPTYDTMMWQLWTFNWDYRWNFDEEVTEE